MKNNNVDPREKVVLHLEVPKALSDFLLTFDPNGKLGYRPTAGRALAAAMAQLGYNHLDYSPSDNTKDVVSEKTKRRGTKKSS